MDHFQQELDLLRKEMQEQIAMMSKRHSKDMQSLRKECTSIRTQNSQILDDVDDLRCKYATLVTELAEMKRLYNREMRKAEEKDQIFEGLKRVFNRALVSAEDGKGQLNRLKADVESLKKQSSQRKVIVPVRSAPASNWSSTRGATAGPSRVNLPPKTSPSKSLYPAPRKQLCAEVSTSCPIQHTGKVRVCNYDEVETTESMLMDATTGICTTQTEGKFKFDGWVTVAGKGEIKCYIYRGDARRELVGERQEGFDRWVFGSVTWDCPKGATIWMELRGSKCDHTTSFKAQFYGELL